MENVREDGLKGCEESAEEGQEETPRCKVVIAICPVVLVRMVEPLKGLHGEPTHASATPTMTGIRDTSLLGLLVLPKKDADNAIVKIGVAARTTW